MNRREFVALGVVGVGGHGWAQTVTGTESGWQLRVEERHPRASPGTGWSMPIVRIIRRGAAEGRVPVEVCNETSALLRVRSANWTRDMLLGPGTRDTCSMAGTADKVIHFSGKGATFRVLMDEWLFPAAHDADVSYFLPIVHGGRAPDGVSKVTLGRESDPSTTLKVMAGQRIHLRLFNGTATRAISVALPGHRFEVRAVDGVRLERPYDVGNLSLSPARYVDVVVPMNRPGRWLLGSLSRDDQNVGFGRLIEYVGSQGRTVAPKPMRADRFTISGRDAVDTEPCALPTSEIVYTAAATDSAFAVRPGVRHRLMLSNLHGGYQTLALRSQTVEVRQLNADPIQGLERSLVSLPPYSRTIVEFTPRMPRAEVMAL